MNDERPLGVDNKANLREELDLTRAEWRRLLPGADTVEFGFVPHTDGCTYVAMRSSSEPDAVVLVFTPSEWDAFLSGVRDGEFDRPS
ncbi:uncharacterized protein DUF397 [Prauserella shujinwangii]|uniref:Uncharacterized protein DUF397 n=1 Tax=Prauserella shujinwangii TaxID=1453103 RepID=A0A2T0LWE6_9PSEU|nr:DUF397 domain-containing protein [Prauserella shujinwangii]PRX48289.1 uncharacterized protein DUF397 [Prauserella shujinwangii]